MPDFWADIDEGFQRKGSSLERSKKGSYRALIQEMPQEETKVAGTAKALETTIPPEWFAEFEAAARRPLATRFRYAFIHTYKPVLDDADYRSFDTMADYRRWCEENLPDWLGYGRI